MPFFIRRSPNVPNFAALYEKRLNLRGRELLVREKLSDGGINLLVDLGEL